MQTKRLSAAGGRYGDKATALSGGLSRSVPKCHQNMMLTQLRRRYKCGISHPALCCPGDQVEKRADSNSMQSRQSYVKEGIV